MASATQIVAAGRPRGRRRRAESVASAVGSVGLGVSVAVEESEPPGSAAAESESSPQALNSASGSRSATRVPRAVMSRVYAPGLHLPEDFGDQVGHLDRVRNARRYVVRVRVARAAEDGREVVEVTVHGVPARLDLAAARRRPPGARTSASDAGVRGGVPGRPASRPSPSSRLTRRACSRGVIRPASSGVEAPRSVRSPRSSGTGWPAPTAVGSTTPAACGRDAARVGEPAPQQVGRGARRRADDEVHPLGRDRRRPPAQRRGVVLGMPEVRPLAAVRPARRRGTARARSRRTTGRRPASPPPASGPWPAGPGRGR